MPPDLLIEDQEVEPVEEPLRLSPIHEVAPGDLDRCDR
jgi:hypothetical protein